MVRMPPRGLVVYETTAKLPEGKATCDLQVHGITTQPGEDVLVCGDAPELGDWDLSRAVPLEYVNRSTWATSIAFDASIGREIHYKYVVRKPSGSLREPGRGHRRHVQHAGFRIWRDDWRT